jgi:two-component system, cell cycle sensor histidine kinase and response regulator CckA
MIKVLAEEVRPALDAPPQPLRGHGILVVDDDEGIREVLDLWFRHQGYDVWLAATGLEAVDLYKQHRDAISVVLMEVNMPEMDGPQTLRAMRQLNPQVCCCYMSADPNGGAKNGVLGMGEEEVLRMPFRLIELDAIVWKLAAPIQRQAVMQDNLWRDDGGQG